MSRRRALAVRWLGVGLASCLAVATLLLVVTGRLALYVNPSSTWFIVAMSVALLVGAAGSFALPLGAEDDHGHDHDEHDHEQRSLATLAGIAGGVVASGVVVAILAVPPASLSADLAMSRDVGAPPLFAGADVVALASSGDTASFGIGEWAGVFASATDPDAFIGEQVTLTGFATPGGGASAFQLTRLVITHCVIDAQTASLPVAADAAPPATGQWVTVTGRIASGADGRLRLSAAEIADVAEPTDPYEY